MTYVWIKLTMVKGPYYDPETGETLASIKGRKNRPGVDRFEGGGWQRPDIPAGLKVNYKQAKDGILFLHVEGNQVDIDKIKGAVAFSPKEIADPSTALDSIKRHFSLPEGTTLDTNKKPVIPKEIER